MLPWLLQRWEGAAEIEGRRREMKTCRFIDQSSKRHMLIIGEIGTARVLPRQAQMGPLCCPR